MKLNFSVSESSMTLLRVLVLPIFLVGPIHSMAQQGDLPTTDDALAQKVNLLMEQVEATSGTLALLMSNITAINVKIKLLQQSMDTQTQRLEAVVKGGKNHRNFPMRMGAGNFILSIPHARLYSGSQFSGPFEDYNVQNGSYKVGCQNLKMMAGHVGSVQAFNSCVRLFETKNCDGQMTVIYGKMANLTSIFSVHSIGPCFEVPFNEMFKDDFQRATVENRDLARSLMYPPRARLYASVDQSGDFYEDYNNDDDVSLANIGCQNVTSGFIAKSIDTFGTCVRLYDEVGCSGFMKPWYPNVKPEDFYSGKTFDLTTLRSLGPCVQAPV